MLEEYKHQVLPKSPIDELLPSEWKKLNSKADAYLRGDTTKTIQVA